MAAIVLPTVYKAIDKHSKVVRHMEAVNDRFANKAVAGINKVERAERKLRKGVSKLAGQFGMLGLSIGALAIGRTVAKANIELEDNLASLSAITGVTGTAFKAFEKQIDVVSKQQKKFAGETAKAFEVVGSAKPELLANADALAKVTSASITLAKASKDDLDVSARNLTGTMNQFNLAAEHSARVMNVLAAGSVVGSAGISEVTEAMKNVGAVAAGANMSVERTVAGIEVLGKFQIKGAEAGTKLRGVILKLQKAGLGYASGQFDINDALLEYQKRAGTYATAAEKDALATKIFGAENITAGKILASNIKLLDEYTKGVTGTNTAVEQAAINSNTLKNRYFELVAAFKNATTSTDSQSKALQVMKNAFVFLADNMEPIITGVTALIGAFITYKTLLFATKAAMVAYNVVLGITTALSGKSAFFVHGNTIAYKAFRLAVNAQTAAMWVYNTSLKAIKVAQLIYTGTLAPAIAATWAFTVALLANPITWIVVGIMALVAGIVLLIKNWSKIVEWVKTSDNVFAKLIRFTLIPIKAVFKGIGSAIDWIKERWQAVKAAFKTGGLLGGLKEIGKSILSFLLKPVELVLQGLSKIPGIGDKFKGKLEGIQEFRATLEGKTVPEGGGATPTEAVNPLAAQTAVNTERFEEIKGQQLGIELTNRTDKDVNINNPAMIPVVANTF